MRSPTLPVLYLAGPEVFLHDAAEIGVRKKALCREFGFEGLFPLDAPSAAAESPAGPAMTIYRRCRAMMAAADAIVANLTPFRSVHADVGTVFELGFFAGSGKPVLAYSNTPDDLLARMRRTFPSVRADPRTGRWMDAEGAEIEDFGLADNLMLDMGLLDSGTTLVRAERTAADPARDLESFRKCLELAHACVIPRRHGR